MSNLDSKQKLTRVRFDLPSDIHKLAKCAAVNSEVAFRDWLVNAVCAHLGQGKVKIDRRKS